ncbi:ferredoxin [Desulfohalobium retbaense]|jgi:ferredoxin|uniref:Ferredoxin n=1 Tax=Desulfohalobium retbaense (strain ATCC 49708 / DSM 5692 / JCM 16813 / HR100) TaxID=485915 RepID=C8WZJ6_DESRD|nr:ferredoxin [Desulfohalobium retbaense]ACV67471.1 ferredoxin [Desulfohalobium retbaense DSM 5692]
MSTSTPEITIDPIGCTGCESCAEVCPECFAMQDGTGLAVVREPLPDPIPDCLNEAIICCPTQCIHVEYPPESTS